MGQCASSIENIKQKRLAKKRSGVKPQLSLGEPESICRVDSGVAPRARRETGSSAPLDPVAEQDPAKEASPAEESAPVGSEKTTADPALQDSPAKTLDKLSFSPHHRVQDALTLGLTESRSAQQKSDAAHCDDDSMVTLSSPSYETPTCVEEKQNPFCLSDNPDTPPHRATGEETATTVEETPNVAALDEENAETKLVGEETANMVEEMPNMASPETQDYNTMASEECDTAESEEGRAVCTSGQGSEHAVTSLAQATIDIVAALDAQPSAAHPEQTENTQDTEDTADPEAVEHLVETPEVEAVETVEKEDTSVVEESDPAAESEPTQTAVEETQVLEDANETEETEETDNATDAPILVAECTQETEITIVAEESSPAATETEPTENTVEETQDMEETEAEKTDDTQAVETVQTETIMDKEVCPTSALQKQTSRPVSTETEGENVATDDDRQSSHEAAPSVDSPVVETTFKVPTIHIERKLTVPLTTSGSLIDCVPGYREEPKLEPKQEPKQEPTPEPKLEPTPEPKLEPTPDAKPEVLRLPGITPKQRVPEPRNELKDLEEAENTKVEKFLKENGYASINSKAWWGQNFDKFNYPLHESVQKQDMEMVQLLLARGADRSRTDSKGRTAQDLARNTKFFEGAALLYANRNSTVNGSRRGSSSMNYASRRGSTSINFGNRRGSTNVNGYRRGSTNVNFTNGRKRNSANFRNWQATNTTNIGSRQEATNTDTGNREATKTTNARNREAASAAYAQKLWNSTAVF